MTGTALNLHPAYRAHLEWALSEVGVTSPRLTDDGEFLFVPLERSDDGDWKEGFEPLLAKGREANANLVLTALAYADAASGLTTGREVAQRLSDSFCIEGGEAYFERICEGHRGNLLYMSESAQFVARRLAAQAKGKEIEVGW